MDTTTTIQNLLTLNGSAQPVMVKLMPNENRLIAAAPELLQALQDMRDAYQRHFDAMPVAWQTYDDIAANAIAKATNGKD